MYVQQGGHSFRALDSGGQFHRWKCIRYECVKDLVSASLQSEPKNQAQNPVKLSKVVRSYYKIYIHIRRTILSQPATAYIVRSTTSGLLLRLPLPFFLHLFQHTHRILGSNEYPLFGTSKRIKCWPDVEREHWRSIWLIWKSVIIDYITDFFVRPWSTDYPVVSVKGRVRAT